MLQPMYMPPMASTVVESRFALSDADTSSIRDFTRDVLLLPLNLDRVHWACLVIHRPKWRVQM